MHIDRTHTIKCDKEKTCISRNVVKWGPHKVPFCFFKGLKPLNWRMKEKTRGGNICVFLEGQGLSISCSSVPTPSLQLRNPPLVLLRLCKVYLYLKLAVPNFILVYCEQKPRAIAGWIWGLPDANNTTWLRMSPRLCQNEVKTQNRTIKNQTHKSKQI